MDSQPPAKTDIPMEFSLLSAADVNNDQKRRSSSRSIKRKRFDDEIVEYSLGLPPAQISRIGRSRTQSQTYVTSAPSTPQPQTSIQSPVYQEAAPATLSPPAGPTAPAPIAVAAVQLPPPPQPAVIAVAPTIVPPPAAPTASPFAQQMPIPNPIAIEKRRAAKSHSTVKKTKKSRGNQQVSTKDLGRWKPIDDLALIIGIQQTNDIRTVHRGVKFSCKFTVPELQNRWYSLLYEEPISRIAVAAMRNLHPEMVEAVQSKALFTTQEEELLGTIKSTESPALDAFQDLLSKNALLFYPSRTAKALSNHWNLMKQYMLLPDQVATNIKPSNSLICLPDGDYNINFSDQEDKLNDNDFNEARDEALEMELLLSDRKAKREIRHLENELPHWTVLVDSITGIGIHPEFDNSTLAVLRGRLVRYLMRSREISIGRKSKTDTIDVDLSLEGPAYKISRRQATLKLRSNGDFFIANEGKRPLFVDGMPLLRGNKAKLNNNCTLEIAGLRMIFLINVDLINAIRQESAKMNGPLH